MPVSVGVSLSNSRGSVSKLTGHRSEFMSSKLGLTSSKADDLFDFLHLSYVYSQTQVGKRGFICEFLSLHWTLITASGSNKEE